MNPGWLRFEQVLDALPALTPAPTQGGFTLAQAMVHGAQGIEYSMTGFPQCKPRWFQRSAGALAFALFSARGRMSHDLSAPIPGAPALPDAPDEPAARLRLRQAIAAFRAWDGPWQPHFAYGALDRAGHERAHAMHLADHLGAFLPPR